MIPSGSLTEVFGFVAQTLSQKGIILDYYFLFWDKVWTTKPKTRVLDENPNFPPKDDGHRYNAFLFRLRACTLNVPV